MAQTTKPIEVITEEEEVLILTEWTSKANSLEKQCLQIRNSTMFLLMLHAGLRVGEIVKLKFADLWSMSGPVSTLIILPDITKTKTGRQIPLRINIQSNLQLMYDEIWYYVNHYPGIYAFYGNDMLKHLTVRQVERIIKAVSYTAIGREIHPHVLRHTFATRLMRTSNIRIVQTLLGHKSISSTQVYTHPNGQDLRKAIESLDPKI